MTSQTWLRAGRELVARAIGEFAYEGLVTPAAGPGPDGARYFLVLDGARYAFGASRGGFGAWRVEPSVTRDGESADDPVHLLADARAELGLSGTALAEALRDMAATHAADARLLERMPSAAALADLTWVDLEAHQAGHPCIVLNKGRLGFSASDAERYAPESAADVRPVWVAVASHLATFAAVPGLDAASLLTGELDAATHERFAALADPAAFTWLPVHPFQWDEVVRPLFADALGRGLMVELGPSPDRYRPLQSVRTLVNLDHPSRHNVKVPLMIRNTLVWRGLSASQTACAPHTTAWLWSLAARDDFLRSTGIVLLGEVASVTVRHPVFSSVPGVPYRYADLLGVIWREPLTARLAPGERARSMASLLVVGSDGRALVAELVARSGLTASAWLSAFLDALLPPLLHLLYRYGASFTPHGENVMVISSAAEVPVRIALKDFGADVELLPDAHGIAEYDELPPHVRAQLHVWPASDLAHSILSAICTGHFRFLTAVLEEHLDVPEPHFWRLVRVTIERYHARFPELSDRFAAFDLFAPTIGRVALNREQLTGGGFHDRPERDAEFDLINGTVANPLAAAPAPPGLAR